MSIIANHRPKPVVLCILDGFGIGDGGPYDGVAQAHTPTWDAITATCPGATLITYGLDVGLPVGQMGNSEVGHTNIGAGRVVMQFLPRVEEALAKNIIKDEAAYKNLVMALRASGGACHLMGLVSDGGVHAHIDHVIGLAKSLSDDGIPVKIHVFTDGRDTPPQSGEAFVKTLSDKISSFKNTVIATVSGRYYAMDRDNRWERVQLAYDAIVSAQGEHAAGAIDTLRLSYNNAVTDEFILPTVIGDYKGMNDGDAVLFANFRSDRAREILLALLKSDFDGFLRAKTIKISAAVGMVEYSDELNKFMGVLFPPITHENILGEVLAKNGLTQLRAAETEKYPHVTFFFNNGREEPYEGEGRLLVPSPKVATYDLQPEMSAPELTDKLVAAIESNAYDAIIINYANPDMVGHTGSLPAVVKAIETVDAGLGRVKKAVMDKGGVLIVVADHGNAEKMWDETTNGPHTAHTVNPVPVYIVGAPAGTKVVSGRLADLAPTVLGFLNVPQPKEMTGKNLVHIPALRL